MISLSGMYQQTLQKRFLCQIKATVQPPAVEGSTHDLKEVNVSIYFGFRKAGMKLWFCIFYKTKDQH